MSRDMTWVISLPQTTMGWFKKRFWLYQKQIQDIRVLLGLKRLTGKKEFVLRFEKRMGWLWVKYAEIKLTDVPILQTLIGDAKSYLRG